MKKKIRTIGSSRAKMFFSALSNMVEVIPFKSILEYFCTTTITKETKPQIVNIRVELGF